EAPAYGARGSPSTGAALNLLGTGLTMRLSSSIAVASWFVCVASACGTFDSAETPSADAGADATAQVDGTPPGCDPSKEPKDQAECLNESFAVFVAPNG